MGQAVSVQAAGDGGEETVGGALAPRGRPRSEARRAAILSAAGDLMMKGGLRAATMEAIAARAGVAKATVYKWWPSRGAVALEGFMLPAAVQPRAPGRGLRGALHRRRTDGNRLAGEYLSTAAHFY
jgi:AcrR family transcriptional regulator